MSVTRQEIAFNPSKPLFVRHPNGIVMGGKKYKKSSEVAWVEEGFDEGRIRIMFNQRILYHNPELEVKNKVGDRLEEMNKEQMKILYNLLNAALKQKTTTNTEYTEKKIKWSVNEHKLRAFIRRWVYSNPWAKEQFETERDKILG
jgi:hypothetical protein